MATLRKFSCYRKLVRAYTRKSKYRQKGYIGSIPAHRIVKFDMGDVKGTYSHALYLKSRQTLQIRHNAIESARMLANRKLVAAFGVKGFHFQINMYPHHILRENKALAGAGADRLSSGMKHSFGRTVGSAAQVKRGKTLFTLYVPAQAVDEGRKILQAMVPRLPCKALIEVVELAKA